MARRCPLLHPRRLAVLGIAVALVALHLACSPGPTVPSSSTSATGEWTVVEPRPLHQDLNAVFAATRHNVWAVGAGGTIARFDGWDSQVVYSGTSANLLGIHGTGPSDIFAVGNGVILHYDGIRWSTVFTGKAVLRGVWCRAPDDVFAVGYEAILHYDGRAWGEHASCPYDLNAVMANAKGVFAVGEGVAGHCDGFSWKFTELTGASLRCLASDNFGDVTAGGGIGPDGAVFAWQRYGVDWDQTATYQGTGPILGWAAGIATTGTRVFPLYYQPGLNSDRDLVWADSTRSITALARSPRGEELWYGVGLSGGLILGRPDPAVPSGISVETFCNGPAVHADRIFGVSGDHLYATTRTRGILLKSDGPNWSAIDTGTKAILEDVWADSAGHVCAVGSDGVIVMGDAQGRFVQTESGTTSDLGRVWGTGPSDLWALARYPLSTRALHYDGAAWRAVDTGSGSGLIDLAGSAADDVWVTTLDGGVLHWDGTAWSLAYSDTTVVGFMVGTDPATRTTVVSGWSFGRTYRQSVVRYDGHRWQELNGGGELPGEGFLVVRGPNDIVLGHVYPGDWDTWRFDGSHWSRIGGPGPVDASSFWGRRDCGLYAVWDGVVWHHALE